MEILDILLENQAPTNKIINAILINSGLENTSACMGSDYRKRKRGDHENSG